MEVGLLLCTSPALPHSNTDQTQFRASVGMPPYVSDKWNIRGLYLEMKPGWERTTHGEDTAAENGSMEDGDSGHSWCAPAALTHNQSPDQPKISAHEAIICKQVSSVVSSWQQLLILSVNS